MCLSPINISYFNALGRHNIAVPCGHCIECQVSYQNDIKVRLYNEFLQYNKAVFVTLTYNEDNVPYKSYYQYIDDTTGEVIVSEKHIIGAKQVKYFDGKAIDRKPNGSVKRGRDGYCRTVYKPDVQLFLKRSRKRYFDKNGQNLDFTYYCTAEYSPVWLRPHYHIILFGVTDHIFTQYFKPSWQLGYTDCSEIIYDYDNNKSPGRVMNYVSKYCCKGSFENPRVKEGTVNPIFHLSSKGLGRQYIIDNLSRYLPSDIFKLFGQTENFLYAKYSTLKYNKHGQPIVKRFQRNHTIRTESGIITKKFATSYLSKCPVISDLILQALSRNLVVTMPSDKRSYKYKLPRYYSSYLQAAQPGLFAQIREYQRRYVETENDKRIRQYALNLQISLSEAYLIVQKQELSKKKDRAETLRKNLSRTYSHCTIQ